jgi:hypothetical protein
MDLAALRTWTIFYLISFVVLLWALFLTTQGVLLGFGLTLVVVVVGLNFFFVSLEVKRIAERQELMASLSASDPGDQPR